MAGNTHTLALAFTEGVVWLHSLSLSLSRSVSAVFFVDRTRLCVARLRADSVNTGARVGARAHGCHRAPAAHTQRGHWANSLDPLAASTPPAAAAAATSQTAVVQTAAGAGDGKEQGRRRRRRGRRRGKEKVGKKEKKGRRALPLSVMHSTADIGRRALPLVTIFTTTELHNTHTHRTHRTRVVYCAHNRLSCSGHRLCNVHLYRAVQ